MRRLHIALAVVVLVALGGISLSEYHKADVAVSSDPIFHMLGDTQHELTRLPVVFTRLSDDEEIGIGNHLAENYSQEWDEKIKKDPVMQDAQAYVSQVGAKVAARAQRRLPYKFHYVPEDFFVNAFALPGGHVFIGQGLINLMDSEDELAAVLGHEVEHIDRYHCVERVQLETRLRRLPLGDIASAVTEMPYQIFAAGYSKEQEMDADTYGTELAVGAGYSASGALRLFETFEQFEPERNKARNPVQELSTVAAENLQEYFRTHPRAELRGNNIKQLIAQRGWPATRERDLRIEYISLSERTAAAFAAYEYQKTIALGDRSISLQPKQPATLGYLYSANMYTGNFAAAAAAAKQLVALEPKDIGHLQNFADALAAQGNFASGLTEFNLTVAANPPKFDSDSDAQAFQLQLKIEQAGLQMLAGQSAPLDNQTAEFITIAGSEQKTREQLSALKIQELLRAAGHWYYFAGKYDKALNAFTAARQIGLGPDELTVMIGFCELRLGRMFVAQSEFDRATGFNDTHAGLSVMYWRTGSKDNAVQQFNSLGPDPKWKNKAWVSFSYGTDIWQSLVDVRAERDRRVEEQKRKNRPH